MDYTDLLRVVNDFDAFVSIYVSIPSDDILRLMVEKDCIVFKSIYSNFSKDKLIEIINRFPDGRPIRNTNTFSRKWLQPDNVNQSEIHTDLFHPLIETRQETLQAFKSLIEFLNQTKSNDKAKSKTILSKLLSICPSQLLVDDRMGATIVCMDTNYIENLIQRLFPDEIVNIFFKVSTVTQTHLLHDVLRFQGSPILMSILGSIYDYDDKKLQNELFVSMSGIPLYKKLLEHPGMHRDVIISSIKNDISLENIRDLLIDNIDLLSIQSIVLLLSKFDIQRRVELVLTRQSDFQQAIIFEKIIQIAQSQILSLLDVLTLFPSPRSRYYIFTRPVTCFSEKIYSDTKTINDTLVSMSSFVSNVPYLGGAAVKVLKSFETEKDVSEFLIFNLLSKYPTLYQILASLFFDFSPRQWNLMLNQKADLVMKLFIYSSKTEIIRCLSNCSFGTPENHFLIKFGENDLSSMRSSLSNNSESDARIGFMALFSSYNHSSTKDPGSSDALNKRFPDLFFSMCRSEPDQSLYAVVQNHLLEYGIISDAIYNSAASSALALLLKLTEKELKSGLILFKEFLELRIENHAKMSMEASVHYMNLFNVGSLEKYDPLIELDFNVTLKEISKIRNDVSSDWQNGSHKESKTLILKLIDNFIWARISLNEYQCSKDFDSRLQSYFSQTSSSVVSLNRSM